jgi:hypothetical protein
VLNLVNCSLFLSTDQLVDEEARLLPEDLERFTLPESFIIYSHDCPQHRPFDAICTTRNGVWSSTELGVTLGGVSQ